MRNRKYLLIKMKKNILQLKFLMILIKNLLRKEILLFKIFFKKNFQFIEIKIMFMV
jgi:hypothetical protein